MSAVPPPPPGSRPPPGAPGWMPTPPGYPTGPPTTPGGMLPSGYPSASAQIATSTSGKAIAALVLGIVGVVGCFLVVPSILALVFGLLARGDVRRNDGRVAGRGMATAGVVLGIVGLVIAAAFFALGFSGAFDDESAIDVEVGDCVGVPDDGLFFAIDEQGCAAPHEGEVYVVDELPGDAEAEYPGEAEVQGRVGERCFDEFAAYVGAGYDDSRYDFVFVFPPRQAWRRDERTFVCIVVDPSGADLRSGSVEGSGD